LRSLAAPCNPTISSATFIGTVSEVYALGRSGKRRYETTVITAVNRWVAGSSRPVEPILSASEASLESVPSVLSAVSLEGMKVPTLIFSVLAGFAFFSQCLAPAHAADASAPFVDPVAYCKAVGAVDAPDARYTEPAVPDWMVAALYSIEEIKAQKSAKVDPARAVVWRCMQGKVYGCVQATARSAARRTRR